MDALVAEVLTPEEAVEIYGPLVLRTAYSLVKNVADAEDVAQDVFVNLLKKAPVFESAEHQKAWLIRCTLNRGKSHFRSAWHRHTVPLEERQEVPFTPQENEVLDAVLRLPVRYREVIQLHYIEGYTAAEIGKILGRKQNTVLSQMARGRELLKEMLKGEF